MVVAGNGLEESFSLFRHTSYNLYFCTSSQPGSIHWKVQKMLEIKEDNVSQPSGSKRGPNPDHFNEKGSKGNELGILSHCYLTVSLLNYDCVPTVLQRPVLWELHAVLY